MFGFFKLQERKLVKGPVVFIDFDGVINSSRKVEVEKREGIVIEEDLLKKLSKAQRHLGFKVVVNSHEKDDKTISEIRKALKGLKIYGVTPETGSRSGDIKEWFLQNEIEGEYAFLSPETPGFSLADRWVTTFIENGITDEDVNELFDLLDK